MTLSDWAIFWPFYLSRLHARIGTSSQRQGFWVHFWSWDPWQTSFEKSRAVYRDDCATSSGGAVILLIYSQSDSLLYLEYQVNNQNGRFRLKKKLIKRKIYNKNTSYLFRENHKRFENRKWGIRWNKDGYRKIFNLRVCIFCFFKKRE